MNEIIDVYEGKQVGDRQGYFNIIKNGEKEIEDFIRRTGKVPKNWDEYQEMQKEEISKDQQDKILKIQEEVKQFKPIFNRIIRLFSFYIDMPLELKKLMALWIIGTYTHSAFETYPFLFLNAMKGSGKTRTERLISHLSKGSKGEVNTGINETALFRCEPGATLVLDECEGIASKDKQTLREYLQASYKKGATVIRMKKIKKDGKEDYEAQKFHPYRPIVMANINGMNDVLGDRCLTLISEKSQEPRITKKMEDFESNEEIKELVSLLSTHSCSLCNVVVQKNNIKGWNNYIERTYNTNYITTQTSQNTLTAQTTFNENDEEFFKIMDKMDIDGRNLELIFPLLNLVNCIMPEDIQDFVSLFKDIIKNKVADDVSESKDIALIEYVSTLTNSWTDYLGGKELLMGFKEYINWSVEEDWLNPKWMGQALKRLKLCNSVRRRTKGQEYLLNIQKAQIMIKGLKKDNIEVKDI